MFGVVFVVGAGLLVAGWAASGYLQTALADIGSAALLAVPILFLGRLLTERVDTARAEARGAVEEVSSLRNEVANVRVRMDELDDLAQGIADRESAGDDEATRAFLEEPEWPNLWALLRRACAIDAVTPAGARVEIPGGFGDRLRVQVVHGDINGPDCLDLSVERRNGVRYSSFQWLTGEPVESVIERITKALQGAARYPKGTLPAKKMFMELGALLGRSLRIRRQGLSPGLGSILEIPNEGQWAVTTLGAQSLPTGGHDFPYTVSYDRVEDDRFFQDVLGKGWVVRDDFEAAHAVAAALARGREWWFVQEFDVEKDPY